MIRESRTKHVERLKEFGYRKVTRGRFLIARNSSASVGLKNSADTRGYSRLPTTICKSACILSLSYLGIKGRGTDGGGSRDRGTSRQIKPNLFARLTSRKWNTEGVRASLARGLPREKNVVACACMCTFPGRVVTGGGDLVPCQASVYPWTITFFLFRVATRGV